MVEKVNFLELEGLIEQISICHQSVHVNGNPEHLLICGKSRIGKTMAIAEYMNKHLRNSSEYVERAYSYSSILHVAKGFIRTVFY